ncbi:cytochrome P450 [Saccharopolyspora sp. HNM0983]|uniref:Cytochrome P450 n=1 Tax=Saccharopolyspora montiporae TaxID=2781240 RepID=A0A929B5K4_9PSEU|nr:cytochrome P450 [Saccharopolyspora sp. HNM0983]MBE9373604.1 cytochrome P450 [Saccharopolyspora sp. HNM0983]
MTSTVNTAGLSPDELPEYPMARDARCPFDPPPDLQATREQGPLTTVRLWDGSTPWLVTRYEQQRRLLADPRVSADPMRPGYPSPAPVDGSSKLSFILMDDPEHARQRRMVAAPFTIKRTEALRPAVQQIVDDRIDEMLAGPKPVDLVQEFALPVPSLVICELLGVPYSDHEFFQANSNIMINRDSTVEQRAEAKGQLSGYLHDLLQHKMADPGQDLLSGLTARIDSGELSREDAAQMGVLLLIAGHETTANMIALGTLALLQHPEQLTALRETDDPALVSSAVEELLRYLHITHSGRRRVAAEDIDFDGTLIRAGDGLIMPNDIGNRDPDVFDDPDRLDIRRNPRNHVAFGFGNHQCLGQPLARLELQVVYGTLYKRIPELRLATDLDSIPFKHDGSVYGVYELPVTW